MINSPKIGNIAYTVEPLLKDSPNKGHLDTFGFRVGQIKVAKNHECPVILGTVGNYDSNTVLHLWDCVYPF